MKVKQVGDAAAVGTASLTGLPVGEAQRGQVRYSATTGPFRDCHWG
ncbi:hypothetical protein [Actinocrispum sp. NPDC049592]